MSSECVCVWVWHDCWYPGGKTQLLNNEPACLYSKRAFIHPSARCQPFDICPRRALGEISPQDLFMPQWNTATWTCARPVKMSKFHRGLVRVCAHSVKRQLRGKLQCIESDWSGIQFNCQANPLRVAHPPKSNYFAMSQKLRCFSFTLSASPFNCLSLQLLKQFHEMRLPSFLLIAYITDVVYVKQPRQFNLAWNCSNILRFACINQREGKPNYVC